MNIVESFLQDYDLSSYGVNSRLCSLVLTPRFPASRHVVFLLMPPDDTDPLVVAKVPRLLEVSDSVQREVANLRAIQALRPEGFDTIPRIIAFEKYHEYPILVETALAGQLMSPAVIRRSPDAHTRAVIDWLTDLHMITTPSQNWYAEIAEKPIQYLEKNLFLEDKPLLNQLRYVLHPLKAVQLPFVVEHGDLGHPNLIMMKSGKVGVVDWELSEVKGMIASDLFFFLSYVAFSLNHANESGDYLPIFEQTFFGESAWARPYIQAYLDHVAIPSEMLTPLFALCWTRYLSNLLMRLSVGEGGHTRQSALAELRSNRYYDLWRYTMSHFQELEF